MLEKELKPYLEVLEQAVDTILDQEVSDFPIMVVHKGEVEVGIPLVNRAKVAGDWSVNASTLEEFTVKNLITTALNHFTKVTQIKYAYFYYPSLVQILCF